MICRTCGVEIADKAIVCFRCGTPTAVPEESRVARPARATGAVQLVLGLMVCVAWAAVAWNRTGAMRAVAASAGVACLVLVLVRWFRRR